MLNVLYEDNHLIVAIKPANIPSQEDSSKDPDMLSLVKEYVRVKYAKPGNVYMGLLHRLDRPAAGLMAFARTSKAAGRLSEDIRQGKFKKVYLAVAHGDAPGGAMEDYLQKDPGTNISSVVEEGTPGAKYAALAYETLENAEGCSLVRIELLTGRPHQIRVQFASRGMCLVGDVRYGRGEPQGLALYSHKIGLIHPVRKEYMEFMSIPAGGAFNWFNLRSL